MSVSYFVIYKGHPQDRTAFVDRYRRKHIPILKTWPGICGVSLHTPAEWRDTQNVVSAEIALLAQMRFANSDDLRRALASEQRLLARQDLAEFPPFDGQMLHQAMQTEEF